MSYEEETTDIRAQVREFALEAAKERSLAEQATRARNTAQAQVRELEAALERKENWHSPDCSHMQELRTIRARAEKAEARVAEHDSWCEYRKRLELSFALGELSGAIKKTPTHREFVNRHDGTGEHLEDVEAREREAE